MTLQEFDISRMAGGIQYLAGIDEAGRGPLAGDVYAAAVILPSELEIPGINDSKKLTERKREALYDIIVQNAVAYCVASVSAHVIDQINILQATYRAMRAAADGLSVRPDYILVDGNRDPGLDTPHECVVKGDAKSQAVAAASILAKVSRDRYMKRIAQQYPQYQFEKHKGYGTALHCELLRQYGPCDIHRRSFLKNIMGEGA